MSILAIVAIVFVVYLGNGVGCLGFLLVVLIFCCFARFGTR